VAGREPELVTIPDVLPAGQDGLQVVVDRQVASAEPVRVARGQPGDEPGHERGLGAAACAQFLPYPGEYLGLGRAGRRAVRQGPFGQADRGEAGVNAERLDAVAAGLGRENLITAALDTEYADACGHRNTPASLVIFTIRPAPRAVMPGRTACGHRKTPRRLISTARHQSSASTRHASPNGPLTPALLMSR
jgi:hypothetical protein